MTEIGRRERIVVDIVPAEGVISYDECFTHHTDADILVNTSPVGMYPKVDASPVDLTAFPHCQAVLMLFTILSLPNWWHRQRIRYDRCYRSGNVSGTGIICGRNFLTERYS